MNHIDYISQVNDLGVTLAGQIRGLARGQSRMPELQECISTLDKMTSLTISRALPESIHVPPKMTIMQLVELMGRHRLAFTVGPTDISFEEDAAPDFSAKNDIRLWDIVVLPTGKELQSTPNTPKYPMAVVACVSPLILASQDARYRWNEICFDVNDLMSVGEASDIIKHSVSQLLTDEERSSTVVVLKRS